MVPSLRLALLATLATPTLATTQSPRSALDDYLDHRFDPPPDATRKLVHALAEKRLSCAGVEKLLRSGRGSYPDPPQARGRLTEDLPLPCDHVDHETRYLLYVPTAYDRKRPTPLLVVGHGGSVGRDLAFGRAAARSGLLPFWRDCAENNNFLIVAPLTDRGWGWIGNSILLSAISRVQRDYHVDPDRIYVTGHSMGGHLSWRSAITMPDRFAAVSPMSGGYDYVQDKQVYNCFNVPGYATCGSEEPFDITRFNATIRAWMASRGFPWVLRERVGGHEIFGDEIPKVWKFFAEHPRDLYRKEVHARATGSLGWDAAEKNERWPRQHVWRAGRAIPASTFHWVRLAPLGPDTPPAQSVQSVRAINRGGNRIDITSEHVRALRLYLHPRMIDFSKPVQVHVNGRRLVDRKVEPDLATMLELVREFDDRGRVFWATVDLKVTDDMTVPEPSYR